MLTKILRKKKKIDKEINSEQAQNIRQLSHFLYIHPLDKQSYSKDWETDCFGNLHIYFVFPINILESFRKKNESINKALFLSTEEDHFLVCYLGSLTFILYFANTKNCNLCSKEKCI